MLLLPWRTLYVSVGCSRTGRFHRRNPWEKSWTPRSSMKKCCRCGLFKAVDEFHRQANHKDGRTSSCKVCNSAYGNEMYKKKRTEVLAKHRADYAANPGLYKEKGKKLRAERPLVVRGYD